MIPRLCDRRTLSNPEVSKVDCTCSKTKTLSGKNEAMWIDEIRVGGGTALEWV